MTIENKILLGNSIELPEEDLNDKKSDLEDQIEALHNYWFSAILNNIGDIDFKQNYLCVIIDIIEKCSFYEQREFCNTLLEKIVEIYDFEFPERIYFNDINDIKDFYYFFEFLEYNNVDFISDVWVFLSPDLSTLSIEEYCQQNSDRIINEIEEQIKSHSLNQLIHIFLRTYIKDNIVSWFSKSSVRIRSLIILKILETRKG